MMNTFRRKLQEEKGLTLVEVLAAIGVLSITLLAILMMYRFNYISGEDTLRQTIATNLARQEIENLREAVVEPGNYSNSVKFNNVEYVVDVEIDSIAGGLYEIVSEVSWDSPFGGKKSVKFTLQRNE